MDGNNIIEVEKAGFKEEQCWVWACKNVMDTKRCVVLVKLLSK